jgi:uncharacterized membrane protein
MALGYSLYQLIWIFIIYAFVGWCIEVTTVTVQTGKFVNRGFLNGPFCPIYGFGMVAVLLLLTPIKSNLLVFFIGATLVTSLIELLTGYILEKNFYQKWWDYSKEPFNFKGYICLNMSLVWGLGCILVVYVIQPQINNFINWIPVGPGTVALSLILLMILVDSIVTVNSLQKVKQQIRILNSTGEAIRVLSDLIGRNISNNTLSALNFKRKALKELEKLTQGYQTILDKNSFGYKRLTKAFPGFNLAKSKKPIKKAKSTRKSTKNTSIKITKK